MLTDFLIKINSKEIPENKCFIHNNCILNNKFSKKIKEIFRKNERINNTIKILEGEPVMGGNK